MVRPVEEDARGIIAPTIGLAKFRLNRYGPSPSVARFVDRYWVVSWDLTDEEPHTQQVLAHPVVNLVFSAEGGLVNGVSTTVTHRTLQGAGRVLGVMFRPAGFRPFLGTAMSAITDRALPAVDVLGSEVGTVQDAVAGPGTDREMVSRAEGFLAGRVPATAQASEETTAPDLRRGRACAAPGCGGLGGARGRARLQRPGAFHT